MTTGADIAINVDVTPGRNPESALTAFVTTLSELPKRSDSTRLPKKIKGEAGSDSPLAIRDQVTCPNVLGSRSMILCSVLGSSDLLARHPSTVAIDVCTPRVTDCSDSPSMPASRPTLPVSSIPSKEVTSEFAMCLSFLSPIRGETRPLRPISNDDGQVRKVHFKSVSPAIGAVTAILLLSK